MACKYGTPEMIKELDEANPGSLKDTDKKGRSRQRDFRQELNSLFIKPSIQIKDINSPTNIVSIELHSIVSSQGKSIKPLYIKHWVSEYMQHTLELSEIKRDELILKRC